MLHINVDEYDLIELVAVAKIIVDAAFDAYVLEKYSDIDDFNSLYDLCLKLYYRSYDLLKVVEDVVPLRDNYDSPVGINNQ